MSVQFRPPAPIFIIKMRGLNFASLSPFFFFLPSRHFPHSVLIFLKTETLPFSQTREQQDRSFSQQARLKQIQVYYMVLDNFSRASRLSFITIFAYRFTGASFLWPSTFWSSRRLSFSPRKWSAKVRRKVLKDNIQMTLLETHTSTRRVDPKINY